MSDHLATELPLLIEWAQAGKLDLTPVITRTVSLDAQAINDTLDHLEAFGSDARVVVTP